MGLKLLQNFFFTLLDIKTRLGLEPFNRRDHLLGCLYCDFNEIVLFFDFAIFFHALNFFPERRLYDFRFFMAMLGNHMKLRFFRDGIQF